MSLKCVIVDDEPIAAQGLAGYAEKVAFMEVVHVLQSAVELHDLLQSEPVDLVFLDIEMPYLTGLDWLRSYSHPPGVIFTTAYGQYAVEGFDLNVIDYLLKPISFKRFLAAANKAQNLLAVPIDHIFIKTDNRLEKLMLTEIYAVESLQNYVTFICEDKRLISHLTLKAVEEQLPAAQFIKTHKSYLINRSKVRALEGATIILEGNLKVPIGKTLKHTIIHELTKNTLKK